MFPHEYHHPDEIIFQRELSFFYLRLIVETGKKTRKNQSIDSTHHEILKDIEQTIKLCMFKLIVWTTMYII